MNWKMSSLIEKIPAVSFMEVFEKTPTVDDSTVDIESVSVNNSAVEALAAFRVSQNLLLSTSKICPTVPSY